MTRSLRSPQRGFTLVEVLLALGLTMLVLAASYAGLTLFQRVTVAGRADAERSQLARAIERRIAADIRCVLYYEQKEEPVEEEEPPAGMTTLNPGVGAAEETGETTGGSNASNASTASSGSSTSSTGSSTSSAESVTITEPTDAYATQSVGVFGDATTLVLHVSKPTRESAAPPPTDGFAPLPGTSDLRSISYFLAVAGGGGLQGAVGNTASGGTALFSSVQGGQGLARLDGDRLAIRQADETGQIDLLAQNATILAPEVTELSFRYFDGTAWVEQWDSVAMGGVPRAIEVTLRIDVDADQPQSYSAFNPAPPPAASDLYRFVVALPLADPTLGQAL